MGKSQTCHVKLFSQENVTGCEVDEIRYTALKLSMPPKVVAYTNNYTCFERTEGSIDRIRFGPGWCSRTIKENETEVGILVNHNLTRGDMWWLCGCNEVSRYGKKEAGTGEHLNTFNNQINKHNRKAAAPHGRLPQTKHKLKSRPGPLSSSTVVTPHLTLPKLLRGTRDR